MHFKPYPGTRKEIDLITGIAPVFRLDPATGAVSLVGTGFWVTERGHLITARHVVQENIGTDGVDRGPIFAVQTFSDRSIIVRNFRKSDLHPEFDLALSETITAPPSMERSTTPIAMSLDELSVHDPVFSFAVLNDDQDFPEERIPGYTAFNFAGELHSDFGAETVMIKFAVRLSFGNVKEIFKKMRDSVMMPFPCIQSDVPIYGGNSGGPLFDIRGRICSVHSSSFEGTDISYHLPIEGVLHLTMRAQSIGLECITRRSRSILELAALQIVRFDPPILDADRPVRSFFLWLRYALGCGLRRERPSLQIHFAKVD